jgi:hypothetical protein
MKEEKAKETELKLEDIEELYSEEDSKYFESNRKIVSKQYKPSEK